MAAWRTCFRKPLIVVLSECAGSSVCCCDLRICLPGLPNHILMLTKDYAYGSSWWRPDVLLRSTSYEPEFNPAHKDRNILALSFADFKDGADHGADSKCRVCFQQGKDIQVPPLESAADGPCHIVYNRSTIRTYSPWSTTRSIVNERKYTLFFAGGCSTTSHVRI